jgi:hypothetical protein
MYRHVPAECLSNVLMVCPTDDFIKKLPGGLVPNRKDFKTFADNPSERIARWEKVVSLSSHLGEQFLELIESGRLGAVVQQL